MMALSPGGNELAYFTDSQLLIRRLSAFEMVEVAVADMGRNLQLTGLLAGRQADCLLTASQRPVKRVSVQGGAALPVCGGGGSRVVPRLGCVRHRRGTGRGRDRAVQSAGGAPEQLVTVYEGETAFSPRFCPAETRCCSRSRRSPVDLRAGIRAGWG